MAMAIRDFVKSNMVLIVGLTLPVLLMAGFLIASNLPQRLGEPPKYSLVFAVNDLSSASQGIPVSVRLVVQDGVLKAQYVRTAPPPAGYVNNPWKKLYLYDAPTRRVRELTFGLPANMSAIETTREDIVEATRGLKLDTTLRAPDGYELAYGQGSRSGLMNDIFWSGSSYSYEPRLQKDNSSYPLLSAQGAYAYVSAEFVGWVVGSN
jgi:hypothetical protein